ncbi:MAG: heterodisulfide reductase-related iron-sulfur binding cluster [Nanoarchaeota archaeon]
MGIKEFFGIGKGKTLLHTGCLLGKYENLAIRNNYELIMKKLGIPFLTDKDLGLSKPFICGSLAIELGFEKEFIKIARKNLKLLRALGVTKIITTCPSCYKALLIDYKDFLMDWDLEVVNAIIPITQKMLGRRVFRDVGFDLVLHDSPYLSRYSSIIEQPRKLLSILGHTVKELHNSKVNTIDSGSSGGLPYTNPQIADEASILRLNQVKNSGFNSLVTIGIMDYEHLKRNNDKNNSGLEVLEMSQLLTHALGISKIEVKI